MDNNTIALFEFMSQDRTVRLAGEKHYRLVNPSELTAEELRRYSKT